MSPNLARDIPLVQDHDPVQGRNGGNEGAEPRIIVFPGLKAVHRNLSIPALIETAVLRGEGILTARGALNVLGGKYTGRSPGDKFIVDEPGVHDEIWWGPVNAPFDPERFGRLYHRLLGYLQKCEAFVFDGFVGADPDYRMPIRVVNELAWQNAFAHQLFIRPSPQELEHFSPEFTIISAPGFKAIPEIDGTRSEAFIILSFEKRLIIIGGTRYAGEIKKSVFTAMNLILPRKGVLSMHCSANVGAGDDVALFFGLSGTGKTSLSADPERRLIGDDEHGWSDKGIFNLEGGCYAKCIRLSKEHEPQIWEALRFGAILENVVVDPATREPDFDSDRLTENTRAAYPVDFIPNSVTNGVAGHPNVIVFLTADAFGVLPPIAKLDIDQAMYHFLLGYTSKLAGTERGITEPQATFSPCFGAPFLPLPPARYANILGEKIRKHNVKVYLVNTGWTGGPYGVGRRISIKHTRAMIRAALGGKLDQVEFRRDPVFKVMVPETCPDVPNYLLNPRETWQAPEAYDRQARELARRFASAFRKLTGVPESIAAAGPEIQE
ncbi:MAG TPA: phosphoenolpyruvate carboxykinase (ATP) [Firmicutes bacterium]|nr:phosphoenolpyruvate carboxykinase (ATP) [Bacillota bacterium]